MPNRMRFMMPCEEIWCERISFLLSVNIYLVFNGFSHRNKSSYTQIFRSWKSVNFKGIHVCIQTKCFIINKALYAINGCIGKEITCERYFDSIENDGSYKISFEIWIDQHSVLNEISYPFECKIICEMWFITNKQINRRMNQQIGGKEKRNIYIISTRNAYVQWPKNSTNIKTMHASAE